jgi:hypothetical protein
LISEISTSENTLTYFDETMSKEYINETFDMVVAPMANVFHVAFRDLLEHLSKRFTGINIPVYVIACGVQADSYEELDDLKQNIAGPAMSFIKSVYNTGGEFGLRGDLTKQFFEKMGFPTAVVTGCPSMYQLGRELEIGNEKVNERDFKPLINGDTDRYLKLARNYTSAEFFDQERFFHVLHDHEYDVNIRSLVHLFGFETTEWVLANKIRMIPNMNDWRNYLINSGFNFSFGSRIHGSIMPILSGIPALIDARDARTKEMAEFFNIPILSAHQSNDVSLYDMYLATDYSAFNKTFSEKFDAYEGFLIEHKIVDKVNTSNLFFDTELGDVIVNGNYEKLNVLFTHFSRWKCLYEVYDTILKMKRKKHLK